MKKPRTHWASILRLHRVRRCVSIGKIFSRTNERSQPVHVDGLSSSALLRPIFSCVCFTMPFSNPVGVRMGSIRRCVFAEMAECTFTITGEVSNENFRLRRAFCFLRVCGRPVECCEAINLITVVLDYMFPAIKTVYNGEGIKGPCNETKINKV